MQSIVFLAFVLCLPVFDNTSVACSDDWPGWMGADRDGVYHETDVIQTIPAEGLKVKWRMPVAGGYAGPAVAGGKVFVFDYLKKSGDITNDPGKRTELEGSERLTAYDESTGQQLWQYTYPCPYSISYPVGPRCTPTVDGDRIYLLGSEGDLTCLNTANGELVWTKNFKRDFGVEILIWGAAAHPLVDGDLLYAMVGGAGQAIVAFDKRTGDVKWSALDAEAGYCPPSIIESAGVRQLIVYHPTGVVSLNPADGSEYWTIPLEPAYQMSIARPMIEEDQMYVSGIGNASAMLKLAADPPTAEVQWRGKPQKAVFSANSTPLLVDGVIYGTDCQLGHLAAVDMTDGSRLWETFEPTQPEEERRVSHGTAFITRLGDSDRYLLFTETGDLMLAKMTAEKFESLGRFHVVEPTSEAFGRAVVWSHPAYANRTAYIRNDKEIVAVDLTPQK
jgi:outer membrane protein assembly factor BamB